MVFNRRIATGTEPSGGFHRTWEESQMHLLKSAFTRTACAKGGSGSRHQGTASSEWMAVPPRSTPDPPTALRRDKRSVGSHNMQHCTFGFCTLPNYLSIYFNFYFSICTPIYQQLFFKYPDTDLADSNVFYLIYLHDYLYAPSLFFTFLSGLISIQSFNKGKQCYSYSVHLLYVYAYSKHH